MQTIVKMPPMVNDIVGGLLCQEKYGIFDLNFSKAYSTLIFKNIDFKIRILYNKPIILGVLYRRLESDTPKTNLGHKYKVYFQYF